MNPLSLPSSITKDCGQEAELKRRHSLASCHRSAESSCSRSRLSARNEKTTGSLSRHVTWCPDDAKVRKQTESRSRMYLSMPFAKNRDQNLQ
eukprot:754682-Hanusia_phi.AAC.3